VRLHVHYNKASGAATFALRIVGESPNLGDAMLDKMRKLALAHLSAQPGAVDCSDPESFYRQTREKSLGWLFRFLVEDVGEDETANERPRFYTLAPDPTDDSVAVLEAHELTDEAATKLPFNKPSGSQSPALGPVIKRTAPSRTKPAGPSGKIQKTTLDSFKEISETQTPWSGYFGLAHSCWSRPRLTIAGQTVEAMGNAYQEAIDRISEKRTVLLAYRTVDGRLPGEVPVYIAYLQETLAGTKYATGAVGPRPGRCAICGAEQNVYPNALKGAGFNIANLDRDGAFPGFDPGRAVDSFGVCIACADLLYVFCRHVSPDFVTFVAGEKALVLPALGPDARTHPDFIRRVGDWLRQTPDGKGLPPTERRLLKVLGDEQKAVATIDILWADFGQLIEGVRGVITDVLPSRLQEIALLNERIQQEPSPLFPEEQLDAFTYDVSLSILRPLLERPGGRAAQKSNESRRLWNLRRELAEAIYHRRGLPERFDAEVLTTARWRWDEAAELDQPVYTLTREGYSEKKKTPFLTLAGWVKQLARFRYYLELVGVIMPEEFPPYQPGVDWLKPYFGPESNIRDPAAVFAFLLGALYGKLLTVQGARGVNVGANALTWLRRLSLSGNDLPELYIKVRGKLLEYETERSAQVRELNEELGRLGVRLGDSIPLDETKTCYFLLLGQALAVKMMPPSPKKDGE
jgi:CRISPR-associated protein Csh1